MPPGMKISVLNSRVGWRVLALFMLAAVLPIALLATLAQRTVSQSLADRELTVLSSNARSASNLTLNRLRLAAQALELMAQASPAAAVPQQHGPLLSVVMERADGARQVQHGPRFAAVLVDIRVEPPQLRRSRQLFVVPRVGGNSEVVLSHFDAGTGRRWWGLVDPAFLWEDAGDLPPGAWLCVVSRQAGALYCSHAEGAEQARRWADAQSGSSDSQSSPRPQTAHAVKALFLGADFGSPDWCFVAASSTDGAAAPTDLIASVLPAVAIASLLLVALLSMVQIRRILRPLARLADGARQMAQRRLGARVEVRSVDEFGELAAAFNDMAAQLEGQFCEIESLASIDRDIVGQLGLDTILAKVALRLASLLPEHCVVVGRLDATGAAPTLCHIARPGCASLEPHILMIDDGTIARWAGAEDGMLIEDPGAGLMRSLFGQGLQADTKLQITTLPLVSGERVLGFMAVAGLDPNQLDADKRRHLLELRNRAAVAASAAEREQRLVHEAHHDSLTGLLNRSGVRQALQRLVDGTSAVAAPLALLFIDIDRFKSVNDNLGHAAGDQVLRDIGRRLRRLLPGEALLARPAGDEFVVVLPSIGCPDAAAGVARAICADLANAHVNEGWTMALGASVGIAIRSDASIAIDDLLRHADQAMYEAKRQGKGRYAFFELRFDSAAQRRAQIERELPLAIVRNELRLLYQPRIDARSRTMSSVEALVRWQHPTRGLCSPAEFIPVAEDSELIEALGRWVIDTACTQLQAWRRAGIENLRVAVNLSARQLDSDRLESDLASALSRCGLKPSDLELEITESVFVGETSTTVQRLNRLRRQGVIIALDDFGTGYSSMSYLRRLPVDILKIDRSFVTDLGLDPAALAVASAIVSLARALRLTTVAEGVETLEQVAALQELGVDEFQGYYFSRPVGADRVVALLQADTVAADSLCRISA